MLHTWYKEELHAHSWFPQKVQYIGECTKKYICMVGSFSYESQGIDEEYGACF